MTPIKAATAGLLVAAALASGSAAAHGYVRFGFNFGFPVYAPYYAPYYYPPPAYYYPPAYSYPPAVVTAPAAPPAYVEQNQTTAAASADQYWYYCRDSQTYYPYVQSCASEWQRVPPRPPGK